MSNRQERLESKIKNLDKAGWWSLRIGEAMAVLLIVGILHGWAVDFGLFADVLSDNGIWQMVVPGGDEAIVWLLGAWWAHRISDGFYAMVDVIGELSETV